MPGESVLAELGAFDGAAEILQAWRDGLAPEPALLVSEWADRHRVLSSRGSAEPGPWRTARTPYLREVMDALSPTHPARRVVFMKGAQTGGTEAGNNWIGYIVHHAPGPMLAVQPTTELAKRFSEQRVDPLVEETPAVRERVAPARSRDSGNRQLSKEFPGGQLVMTGANSAVGLRAMSARFLFLDEVDAYPGDVEGDGDPVALAEARADLRLAAQDPAGQHAHDLGAVAHRARLPGHRPAALLRAVPALRGDAAPALRAPGLGQGPPRHRPLPLRGLRRRDRRAAQDGHAGRGGVAPDGRGAGPARGRLPHLGALLAGRLVRLEPSGAGVGGGAGRRPGGQDLP